MWVWGRHLQVKNLGLTVFMEKLKAEQEKKRKAQALLEALARKVFAHLDKQKTGFIHQRQFLR